MKNSIKNTVKNVYSIDNTNSLTSDILSQDKINEILNPSGYGFKIKNENSVIKKFNTFNYKWVLIVLSIFIIVGLIIYFREDLLNYFGLTKKDDIEKEPEKEEPEKEEPEKEEPELPVLSLNKKNEKDVSKKDKMSKKTKSMPDKLLQQYSKSQIVGENGSFCYIGEENNMRECVDAYKGDICKSGDIYKRIDKCLVPDLR